MENKITVTINEDGSLKVEFPIGMKSAEIIGNLEMAKTLITSGWINGGNGKGLIDIETHNPDK
jgi:hypothetical protein